jgi:hypothetical protein
MGKQRKGYKPKVGTFIEKGERDCPSSIRYGDLDLCDVLEIKEKCCEMEEEYRPHVMGFSNMKSFLGDDLTVESYFERTANLRRTSLGNASF